MHEVESRSGRGADRGISGRSGQRWCGRRAGRRRSRGDGERGSATAEYAVVILAAVAFAGVLVAVMRSAEVQAVLSGLVRGALQL